MASWPVSRESTGRDKHGEGGHRRRVGRRGGRRGVFAPSVTGRTLSPALTLGAGDRRVGVPVLVDYIDGPVMGAVVGAALWTYVRPRVTRTS